MRKLGAPANLNNCFSYPVLFEKDRFRHLYVLGKTQTGKSTFLVNLILQELDHCLIFLDPHGSAVKQVAAVVPPIRLLYISKASPIVFNPLTYQLDYDDVAKLFTDVVDAVVTSATSSPETTVLHHEILRNAIRVIKQKDIGFLARFLNHTGVRKKHIQNDRYWTYFDERDNREKREAAKRVGARLSAFAEGRMRLFTIGKNQFDVRHFVYQRKVVLIDLSGFNHIDQIYLGNLVAAAIIYYANYQADENSPPLFFYVDELQRFISPYFADMLAECGKKHISITLCHQNHAQINKLLLETILGNVYSMIVFSCGFQEAKKMAAEFQVQPNDFLNLANYEALLKIGTDVHKIITFPPPAPPIKKPFNFLRDCWFEV